MSFCEARVFADEMTLSDFARDVESRERLELSVECRFCSWPSSALSVCSVDCNAAFWDESAGRADVDWAICECKDCVRRCDRCDRRASFSGFTGIGGAGILEA